MTTFFETTLFNSVFILVLIWFPALISYLGTKKNLLGKICDKAFPFVWMFMSMIGGLMLICCIFSFAWFSASDILDMSPKMHDLYAHGMDKESDRFYLFLLVLCVQGYIYFKITKFALNISGKKD